MTGKDEVTLSEIYIHAENLCYTYHEGNDRETQPALKGLTVDIREGEYVAVLGHNGSGKSTFAKLLNLILEPTGGRLTVGGIDLSDPNLSDETVLELRRNVGMVFQNPDNQLVATVVEQDVAFGPENLGIERGELRRRVDEALQTVGMTQYARQEPHRLSGGQKQRVAIAGVLAMRPKCVIFDEATAMLDPGGRREVLETIRCLNRNYGMTVLNITHYMNEAAQADRILVMDDGELFMDGTPDEVFARREELLRVGLEVPQCAELVHRLRALGIRVDGSTVSDPEACADLIADAYAKTLQA